MNRILFILFLSFSSINAQESMVKYELVNLEINNKFPNFGASFFGNDKIVFTSSKAGNNLNLYVANGNNENISDYSLFSKSTKSNTHETNVTFTKDKKTMYFTRSIKGKENTIRKNTKARIAIFRATLSKNGIWENIKAMPFNSSKYDCAHPTLNIENTMLYFTSNMPGTLGDNDIFEVVIHDDGSYSVPRNLGDNVNTKGKEMFPFMSSDNFLYFSSNGHKENYGGLDIYYVKINGSSTTKSTHLIDPINSRWDDFSYIFNPTKRIGYLSSNRPTGKGDDDIYFVKEVKNEPKKDLEEEVKNCEQSLIGIVHSNNDVKSVVSSAIVTLQDINGKKIETKTTRSNARFRFYLKCNKNYKISAVRDDFSAKTISLKSGKTGFDVIKKNINLELKTSKKIYQTASGVISFSFNDTNLLEFDEYQLEKTSILMRQNEKLKVIIESHTDSRGDDQANMELTERRVAIVSNYFLKNGFDASRVVGNAYGETKLLNKCKNKVKCTTKEHLKNRRTTYKLTEL